MKVYISDFFLRFYWRWCSRIQFIGSWQTILCGNVNLRCCLGETGGKRFLEKTPENQISSLFCNLFDIPGWCGLQDLWHLCPWSPIPPLVRLFLVMQRQINKVGWFHFVNHIRKWLKQSLILTREVRGECLRSLAWLRVFWPHVCLPPKLESTCPGMMPRFPWSSLSLAEPSMTFWGSAIQPSSSH